MDTGAEPDSGGGIPIPVTVNCREGTGTTELFVDIVDLIGCFPPDCEEYPETNCWPPEMPVRLRDCDPNGGTNCFVDDAYVANLEPVPDGFWGNIRCVCEGGGTADLGDPVGPNVEDACCDDPAGMYDLVYVDILPWLDSCDSVLYQIYHDCEPDAPATWEVCDPGDIFSVAPNAEYVLHIDETLSYVTIDMPLDTKTVSVVGGGSARTGPDKFLTATIAAGDGALASQNFTEWLWWMDGPMDIDVSAGTISVPLDADQPFYGRGKVNAVPHWAEIHMGDDAWGTIDDGTQTWTLDFVQDSLGWEVQIHLEGSYEDAD